MNLSIPKEAKDVMALLAYHGFEAYLVGGSVRDLLLGTIPKDWDIATNALPEEIQKLFPDHVYENHFGTVGIKTGSEDPSLAIIEVTTYRVDGEYTDARRPDAVSYTKKLEEDLARRDFTINAMAYGDGALIDPFDGEADLKKKIIRCVGEPLERFGEDALRLLRAVRFAAQLDFSLEEKTKKAIQQLAPTTEGVSHERVRDEFSKLLMTKRAEQGVVLMQELGLLAVLMPEIEKGVGVGQNKHHIFSVFEHNVKSLAYAAENDFDLTIRLAALLHDVGKPQTKKGEGKNSTFYNHEIVGARIAKKFLERLKYPKEVIKRARHLVRHHMFYYNVDEVSDAGVRRFVRRVGEEYIDDLFQIRECDRIGSGVPKAVPYKLRHLRYMIDKVRRDPISTSMLATDGDEIMKKFDLKPSRLIGDLLALLLEEVIDDPARNEKKYLLSRTKELLALSDEEREKLSLLARDRKNEEEEKEDARIKRNYHVK